MQNNQFPQSHHDRDQQQQVAEPVLSYQVIIIGCAIIVLLLVAVMIWLPWPTMSSFGIPSWIWIVLIALIIVFLIWKYLPSFKKFWKWLFRIALAVLIIYGAVWLGFYLYYRYHTDSPEENFPTIPEITYGTQQHMDGNKWYKYRCVIDGKHVKYFITPQLPDTYQESRKLGIEGIWGEVRINQDDTVDVTKNY